MGSTHVVAFMMKDMAFSDSTDESAAWLSQHVISSQDMPHNCRHEKTALAVVGRS